MSSSSLLEIHGITKSYPGVIANEDVKFTIKTGEIHALLGENGAGKSTLVKTIYGLVKPDKGLMKLNGNLYSPNEPRDARACGVAMVFQHFSLFEALTVVENISLALPPQLRQADLSQRIASLSNDYGYHNWLSSAIDLYADKGDVIVLISVSGESENLVNALKFLGQSPPTGIIDSDTKTILDWAIDNWSIELLPNKSKIHYSVYLN